MLGDLHQFVLPSERCVVRVPAGEGYRPVSWDVERPATLRPSIHVVKTRMRGQISPAEFGRAAQVA